MAAEGDPKRRRTAKTEKEKRDSARPVEEEKDEESGGDVLLRRRADPEECERNVCADLLQTVFEHLSSSSSIPDLLSFSGVCTSWRSVARSSYSLKSISLPPLLLSSATNAASDPYPRRSDMTLLKTLTSPRTYRSPISQRALKRRCCGCSHGHLIFDGTYILIADVFSSFELYLRKPRPHPHHTPMVSCCIIYAVLTGPPSLSSSMIIFICSRNVFWRGLGEEDKWSVSCLRARGNARSVLLSNGYLYVLHDDMFGTLYMLEFNPKVQWTELLNLAPFCFLPYMRLADCGGEILLLCLRRKLNMMHVCRMDLKARCHFWRPIESIGDWCLFMDYVGKCILACQNPGKWGGQNNCVYFSDSKYGRLNVLPLDGTQFKKGIHIRRPHPKIHHPHPPTDYGRFASSAWVYPSNILTLN